MRPHAIFRLLRAMLVPLLTLAALIGGLAVAAAPAAAAAAPSVQSATLSPSQVNFGSVAVGGSAVRTARLTSTGNAPLKVRSIDTGPNAPDVIFYSPVATDDLAPGKSRDFNLAVEPTSLGPVDTLVTLTYGDDAVQKTATIHVTYTAVAPPVLPYAHFDLRLDDSFWISLLGSNYSLAPTAGATGATPGPFIFPVSSGTVTPTNTGVLTSNGGLELNHTPIFGWNRLSLDLTHKHLTAAIAGIAPRVNVADLTDVYDNTSLLGQPTTDASVALTDTGSAMLNATGLKPSAHAGQYIGFISVLKN